MDALGRFELACSKLAWLTLDVLVAKLMVGSAPRAVDSWLGASSSAHRHGGRAVSPSTFHTHHRHHSAALARALSAEAGADHCPCSDWPAITSETAESDASAASWQVRALWPGLPHIPQHRTFVRPPPAPLSSGCISCTPFLSIVPWPSDSCAPCIVSDPLSCTRVFLALRRLLSASLALQSEAFSARRLSLIHI